MSGAQEHVMFAAVCRNYDDWQVFCRPLGQWLPGVAVGEGVAKAQADVLNQAMGVLSADIRASLPKVPSPEPSKREVANETKAQLYDFIRDWPLVGEVWDAVRFKTGASFDGAIAKAREQALAHGHRPVGEWRSPMRQAEMERQREKNLAMSARLERLGQEFDRDVEARMAESATPGEYMVGNAGPELFLCASAITPEEVAAAAGPITADKLAATQRRLDASDLARAEAMVAKFDRYADSGHDIDLVNALGLQAIELLRGIVTRSAA